MKTLILDFGNVVAFFDHQRACRQLASLSISKVTEEVICQEVFGTTLEADFDCGRLSAADFVQSLRKLFDLGASDDAIVTAWCDIFWANEQIVDLIPHFKTLVAKLILASNTNELHYHWFNKQFAKPLSYFDELVLSHRVGYRKPALPFFGACIEASGANPTECVYIDDRPDFVQVARSLGMAGIVYSPDVNLLESLANEGLVLR